MNDDITVEIVGDLQPDNKRPKSNVVRQQNMVVGTGGVSPCIPSTHTQHEFKIMETEPRIASMKSRDKDNPTGVRTKSNGNFEQRLEPDPDNTSNTVTSVSKDNLLIEPTQKIRIRRLTERELFRLMDVDEADIDILLSAGIAKTQLAKMAGNSIVVACLEGIFRNLLIDTEPQAGMQTKLF